MTRIIRSDLEGVVHAHLHDGTLNAVVLQAGDVVPDGVLVGDHLLAPQRDDVDTDSDRQAAGLRAAETRVQGPSDDEPGDKDERGDAPVDDDSDELLDDDGNEDELSDGADDEDVDTDADTDADADDEGLEAPRGNASTEAWAEYADALGVEYDDGATRTEIQAAVAASKNQA